MCSLTVFSYVFSYGVLLLQVIARQQDEDDLCHIGNIDGRLLITPDLEPLLAGV